MKRLGLILSLLTLVCLPLAAQQMRVEEFTRLKGHKVLRERSAAILDLLTDDKGFTFFSDRGEALPAQEWVGFVRVRFPKKSSRVLIRHPEYGQLLWEVPSNGRLRRGRHYQAVLYAADPTKEYKASHQWVVFRLNPENMMLKVDSTTSLVRQPVVEYYLPVGRHSYRAEAPFFDPVEAKFTLSDSVRADISVDLQPLYSFLSVKTEWKGKGKLYIDNVRIRKEAATSYRLPEGHHRVNYFLGDLCVYDTLLYLGRSEKKVLELKPSDLSAKPIRLGDPLSLNPFETPAQAGETPETVVKLSTQDPETDIWVDREWKGTGHWEGRLSRGYHLVQAVKDGQESSSVSLMIEDDFPVERILPAAGIGYGLLNIHCDVEGASIRIDGQEYGETPRIVRVEASHSYEVTVYKAGYKSRKCRVRPKGNGEVDVFVQLKKK